MADIDFDEYGDSPRMTGGQAQRLVNLAGAVSSVALIIGVAVWGYRLAVRDVSGIPVFRAVEGPMRVAPDNPGGSIADHQGMAINVIAEVGATEAMPNEIVLAPAPTMLATEDTAGLAVLSALAPAAPRVPQGPDPRPLETARLAPVELAPMDESPHGMAAIDPTSLQVPPSGSTEEAVAMALAEALGSDASPLADGEDETALTSLSAEEAIVPQDNSEGLARSLRPKARPEGARTASATVAPAAAPEAEATLLSAEIDPATLSKGTRLVQLGAYDTADQARSEWTKLAARFGDLMTGKAPVVQAAESGGRTFYRLRAQGFDGEDDVRRFCSALVAENAACIPATVR